MNILDTLNARLAILAGIVTSLLVLLPQVRAVIAKGWSFIGRIFGGSKMDLILAATVHTRETMESIQAVGMQNGERLAKIEKELQFNGGRSAKDMLYLLARFREHDFWRIGRPAIEMDGLAQICLVSEAACRLFCVNNPQELYRRSWLRFIDSTQVEDFLSAFKETVGFSSEFVFTVRVHCNSGRDRGLWQIRASPITPEDSERKLYSGCLSPACDVAKEVAKEIHWSN